MKMSRKVLIGVGGLVLLIGAGVVQLLRNEERSGHGPDRPGYQAGRDLGRDCFR